MVNGYTDKPGNSHQLQNMTKDNFLLTLKRFVLTRDFTTTCNDPVNEWLAFILPWLQLGPVHPSAQLQWSGDTHVPPLAHPPSQIAVKS